MKIIAHRGLWKKQKNGNTMDGFLAAFNKGYGIETDIRDYDGKIVVSHNIASQDNFLFEDVLKLYKKIGCNASLAINIKADGLQRLLKKLIQQYDIQNYFVFDMSIPEQVVYHKEQFNVFTRMSDFESVPVLIDKAQGIWMDEWESSWINPEIIKKYTEKGKLISIISPEIHGRDYSPLWNNLKQFKKMDEVMLCTDIPEIAEEYFNEY